MATQMITVKIDSKLLKEVDDIVRNERYQNRTELIRESLRKKINESKLKTTLEELKKLRGSVKRKITDEQYEWARRHALELLD